MPNWGGCSVTNQISAPPGQCLHARHRWLHCAADRAQPAAAGLSIGTGSPPCVRRAHERLCSTLLRCTDCTPSHTTISAKSCASRYGEWEMESPSILAGPFENRQNASGVRCQQSQGPEEKGGPETISNHGLLCDGCFTTTPFVPIIHCTVIVSGHDS